MSSTRESVESLASDVRHDRTSAESLAIASSQRLRAAESLHAFLAHDENTTQELAATVDRAKRGRLAGVPIAIKDNICTLEYPTTCGSRILEGYRSPFEATAIRRLKNEGAV